MYVNAYHPAAYPHRNPFINQGQTPTAIVWSSNAPVCKQKNRSSNNFNLPTGNYAISAPAGVTFNIYQDKTGKDPLVGQYQNGAATSSKYKYPVPLTSGNQYYFANPVGASAGFNVNLTAT